MDQIGNTEEQILSTGGEPVSSKVLDQKDDSIKWKQCITCRSVKDPKRFRADSSQQDGRVQRCLDCEAVPKLSMEENYYKRYEDNYFSAATKSQRWKNTTDYLNDEARLTGRWMHWADFVQLLQRACPDLFIMEGGLHNHLAVYEVHDRLVFDSETVGGMWRSDPLGCRYSFNSKYVCGIPMVKMPEYSTYVIDDRDIIHKQKQKGWRTPLLQVILKGYLPEQKAIKIFGEPRGEASVVYRRTLYEWRNRYTTQVATTKQAVGV